MNVKRLIIHKMSVDAIPDGGGLAAGLAFLSSRESIAAGWRAATLWVEQALAALRQAAEPNPWRDSTDEEIAAEILRQIDERKNRAEKNRAEKNQSASATQKFLQAKKSNAVFD